MPVPGNVYVRPWTRASRATTDPGSWAAAGTAPTAHTTTATVMAATRMRSFMMFLF